MKRQYVVRHVYKVYIDVPVVIDATGSAEDEGVALSASRKKAEEESLSNFEWMGEESSEILDQRDVGEMSEYE